MAAKSLTKEMRSIVSEKTAKTRKRMAERNVQERIGAQVGGFAGAGLSAFVDGRSTEDKASGEVDKIELGNFAVDTNVLTGGLSAGVGFWMNKGAMAHGLAESGMTQLKISFYRMLLSKAEESESEESEE